MKEGSISPISGSVCLALVRVVQQVLVANLGVSLLLRKGQSSNKIQGVQCSGGWVHLPKILLRLDWLEQLIGKWKEYNGQWRVHLPQSPTRQSPTEDNLPLSATFYRRHLRNACQHTLHIYIPASSTAQFSNRNI